MKETYIPGGSDACAQHATDCNRLQQNATLVTYLKHLTHANNMQQTATDCNRLQQTATPVTYLGNLTHELNFEFIVALDGPQPQDHLFVTVGELQCVLHCVLQCVFQCVFQCVLQCVLQCVFQCVLQCVALDGPQPQDNLFVTVGELQCVL